MRGQTRQPLATSAIGRGWRHRQEGGVHQNFRICLFERHVDGELIRHVEMRKALNMAFCGRNDLRLSASFIQRFFGLRQFDLLKAIRD